MATTSLPSNIEKRMDALDQALDQLIAEFGKYSSEQLNAPAADGGWSAMQCIEHMKLSEKGTMAYIQKKLSFSPDLPKKGFIDTWRKMLLVGYLASPVKFKAPKGIGTDYLPETADPASSFAEWKEERKAMRAALADIDPKYYDKAVFKHPLAGRISLDTTLAFLLSHLKRHRKQALRAIF